MHLDMNRNRPVVFILLAAFFNYVFWQGKKK